MTGSEVDIAEIFRDEARERLDRMVTTLLAIEAGDESPKAIDSIFRDAHSIKGSAAMVGFDETRVLAHGIEDELGKARELGSLPEELVGPLLSTTDALRRSLDLGAAPTGPIAPVVPSVPAGQSEGRRTIRMPTAKVDRLLDAVGESVVQTRRLEHVLGPAGTENAESTESELNRGKLMLAEL